MVDRHHSQEEGEGERDGQQEGEGQGWNPRKKSLSHQAGWPRRRGRGGRRAGGREEAREVKGQEASVYSDRGGAVQGVA